MYQEEPIADLSISVKLAIVLISAAFHHGIYLGSGKFFTKMFNRFNFTYADQRAWRSKCTSLVHSLIVGSLGAYVLFVEGMLDMDTVWASTNMSTLTMAISAGYFLWDSIVVLVRYDLFGFLFALHGVYCLYVYLVATFYVVYHYHAMALLMFEWSTPSMNLFFMADQVETRMEEAAHPENRVMTRLATREAEKNGAPVWFKRVTFFLSGVFALHFFLVRILWGHYHYYQFYRVVWVLWYETPAWLNISLMALIAVAFLLNGTWFIQIILTGLGIIAKPDPNTRPLPKSTEEPLDLHILPESNNTDDAPEAEHDASKSKRSTSPKSASVASPSRPRRGSTTSPKPRKLKAE